MNPQLVNQNDPQTNIELRIRTMRILWTGMLLSIGVYYVFTVVRGRSLDITPNRNLSLILLGVAVLTTSLAFLIKNRLLTRAVEQRQVPLVQQAYILTWAITEVAALVGMLDFFTAGDPNYYLLFIIAACGMLLHFPRREPVENAAFKSGLTS